MGKKNCAKCRAAIPASACNNPRINSALVMAIRHAKAAAAGENRPAAKPQHFMANDDRPDQVRLRKGAVCKDECHSDSVESWRVVQHVRE